MISDLLMKFCDFYQKNTFFVFKKLGELDNTCYPESEIVVIDYDEVKRKCICHHIRGLKDFQSCDAMKILKTKIDFIEMKSLKKYLEHYSEENKEKMLNKNFSQKFEESMFIFNTLLKVSTLNFNNEQISEIMGSLRYYIVLIDVKLNTPDELLARLDFLANPINDNNKLDEITNKIIGDLYKTEIKYQIQSKLMFKEELDYLYSA